jgi:ubiquitin carboxyl-terminal hydrolase 48
MATVASLQIFANSVIDLKEENEIHEISDSEEVPKKKSKRDEGGGFGGTVLGRTENRSSSPPKATEVPEPAPVPPPTEKTCHACTFSNGVEDLACGMCNEIFA